MKIRTKNMFFSGLAVSAVSAFPAIFMYCQNADEAGFTEVLPVLLGSMGVGILLLLVTEMIIHSAMKAAIITAFLMFLLLNFSFLEGIIKSIFLHVKYWQSLPVFLIIGLHFAYIIHRFLTEDIAEIIVKVFCVVFCGLLALNIITAAPQIINHMSARLELKQAQNQEETTEINESLPHVYFLIFDEYANFPQMKDYYAYDNDLLQTFFADNKFNVSYTSHNESLLSETIQTNMMNMDYIVDDGVSASDKEVLRKKGLLFNLMREHGYKVEILERNSKMYGGTLPGNSKESFAATINGEDLQTILLKRTALYPYFTFDTSQKNVRKRIAAYNIIGDYLSDPDNASNGLFTLAYFDIPHQPFVVDENGKLIKGSNSDSGKSIWENKNLYLGQYIYTTKLMIKILGSIINNDPKAIIMVMSDHGARGTEGATWETKTNSLNALYYQGNVLDIEGLSNVNTIRAVVSKMFNLNYEMVDIPESFLGGGGTMKKVHIKPLYVIYIFIMVGLIIWLIVSTPLITKKINGDRFEEVNFEQIKKKYMKDVVHYSVQSGNVDFMRYDGGLFDNFFACGWAFCETEKDNSQRKVSIVLKGSEKCYELLLNLNVRDDVKKNLPQNDNQPDMKIYSSNVGYTGSFSLLGVKDDVYDIYLCCKENEINYGMADTLFQMYKHGDEVKISKWKSQVVDNPIDITENKGTVGYLDDISSDKELLTVRGWEYIPGKDSDLQEVYIEIIDSGRDSKQYYSKKIVRTDVSETYNNTLYGQCGYVSYIPMTDFADGDYTVRILVENEGEVWQSKEYKIQIQDSIVSKVE